MAVYTEPPAVVTGQTMTATNWNSWVRTNFQAVWPFTTAGDLAYASAANQLKRLGIGTAGKFLKSTGSAPSWANLSKINAVDLKLSADLYIDDITYVTIDWTSEVIDTNSMHSLVTNKSRVNILETGWYLICFQAIWEVNNMGLREALILKNGTTTLWKVSNQTPANAKLCQVVSGLEYLVAGDYITTKVWQNAGEKQLLNANVVGFPDRFAYTRLTVLKVSL